MTEPGSLEHPQASRTGWSAPRADIAARIAALGAAFDRDILLATRELFADQMRTDLPASGRVVDNVPYGEDERQRLDVFTPGGEKRPIVVFVPGGGFVGGDRRGYKALGAYFARNGFVAVVPDYRLAPAHSWPAGAHDVAAVIDWAIARAETYGGDPGRIFVFGQSAGATHAAGALFDPDLRPSGIAAVRGAVLMNGIHRMTAADRAPNMLQYFGEDASLYEQRSPLTHVGASRIPLLLILTEFDPTFLATGTLELATAATIRDGSCPPLLWLRGHNHVSPLFALGTDSDGAGPAILEFLRRVAE
ncbi:MAG: Alpha/beta hydrolase fold-3 domain protein [Enterovirga sp.]|nr:Alpha/beta hydrolase fold-3 domain protein [Enterovirga sp.]